ncbi:MAG: zinc-dependent metalloprotease [Ferruginibacter sp.]|nr:zinc-dependent metalloprotease [Ferruginibacter sp.]
MRKIVLLTTMLVLVSFLGFSQTDNFWSVSKENRNSIVTDKAVARLAFPKEFKLFSISNNAIKQQLFTIVDANGLQKSTVISLPNANGELEQFEVYEASNFEPELQARFPEIRAFSGKGITDKYATLKLSYSPQGIQTMVFRADKPTEFIEPYSQDHGTYAVFISSRDKSKLGWKCNTVEANMVEGFTKTATTESATGSSNGTVKTMRLAQSCNGEYSNYFGATSSAQVGLVMAAFNATLTRCNGVYEKDLALHLNLIANTTAVIYYSPSTDPYSTTLSQWNAQLQSTLTSVIGEANYDIGHMFGASGGGGNAGCIGCVCVNGSKGSGITSPNDGIPTGDNFDIDYVVHEVGHQLGANHTFSMSNEGTGVNKEIGSGITIMGYAGITSQDVAPHSIDIYHQASIAQIQANLATKTCPISTNITANNVAPVIAALSNYTIPISTPFALTGSATDANGDAVTYCWEQNDNASSTQTGTSSVASPTKATGPNWLSFSPSASGTRMFPKLATILSGLNVSGPLTGGDAGTNTEALSSVSRTLNFRLTVRDNHAFSSVAPIAVAQTAFADAVVTVSNTSGPFAVTVPNTAVSWADGSAQTITWSVNNTTAAPVSCANVNILLSTDGGVTFTTILAAATPNDGSETIIIPSSISSTCRVKVESVGNIFFDISNANFSIVPALIVLPNAETTKDKVIVSPNPANSIVNVEFSTNVQSNSTKLTVTDQMGNIVLQKIISTVKGVNKKTLDISMLKNGIYSVNITKANTVISSKVIVNK